VRKRVFFGTIGFWTIVFSLAGYWLAAHESSEAATSPAAANVNNNLSAALSSESGVLNSFKRDFESEEKNASASQPFDSIAPNGELTPPATEEIESKGCQNWRQRYFEASRKVLLATDSRNIGEINQWKKIVDELIAEYQKNSYCERPAPKSARNGQRGGGKRKVCERPAFNACQLGAGGRSMISTDRNRASRSVLPTTECRRWIAGCDN
jgi:hypothetical protein